MTPGDRIIEKLGRGTMPAYDTTINQSGSAGSSYIFAEQPEEKPNVLDRAIAIASTLESYRRDAEDGAALLKSGWVWPHNHFSDRPGILVAQE